MRSFTTLLAFATLALPLCVTSASTEGGIAGDRRGFGGSVRDGVVRGAHDEPGAAAPGVTVAGDKISGSGAAAGAGYIQGVTSGNLKGAAAGAMAGCGQISGVGILCAGGVGAIAGASGGTSK